MHVLEIADRALQLGQHVIEHGPHGLEQQLQFSAVAAFRLRCSAAANVSLSSLGAALVKWFPPSGMLRLPDAVAVQ